METPYDSQYKKKLATTMTISLFVIFSIYSFVLTTLYVKSHTDISFMIPVFVDIIPYITDLTEIAAILISYAFILYAFCRFDKPAVINFTSIFVAMTFYKYLAKLAVTYIMNGSFPQVNGLFGDLLLSIALPAFLEYFQLAIVILLAWLTMRRGFEFIKSRKALEGRLEHFEFDERSVFFPFKKMFDKANPLQQASFRAGLIVMISKMVQLLIIDIGVGLPTDINDLLWMIASYTLCILLGFAAYLFILFLLISLNNRDIKLKYTSCK